MAAHTLPQGPKLNIGCGPVQPAGWVNIDGSNRAWLSNRLWPIDKLLVSLKILAPTEFGRHMTYHNLLKPLPFADGSVAAIYAGELWEHFLYSEADQLTGYCYKALAKGGVLRVCVPDSPEFFEKYLKCYRDQMALPPEQRSSKPTYDMVHSFFKDICTKPPGLHSMGHYHKWSYDEIQLMEMFRRHGFKEVARAKYHESRIPDVHVLERSDFLIVEGVK